MKLIPELKEKYTDIEYVYDFIQKKFRDWLRRT